MDWFRKIAGFSEDGYENGGNVVLLTRPGGGAFGNDASWIEAAQVRALDRCRKVGLDVRLVAYGEVSTARRRLVVRYLCEAGIDDRSISPE